jgi:hypothetical protein
LVNLNKANLNKANLVGANFSGANLHGVKRITWEQIAINVIDETTKLPPDLEERRKAEQAKKAAAPDQSTC